MEASDDRAMGQAGMVGNAAVEEPDTMRKPPSLHGPLLKLLRAQEHLDTFDELSGPFVSEETTRIRKRYDANEGVQGLRIGSDPDAA